MWGSPGRADGMGRHLRVRRDSPCPTLPQEAFRAYRNLGMRCTVHPQGVHMRSDAPWSYIYGDATPGGPRTPHMDLPSRQPPGPSTSLVVGLMRKWSLISGTDRSDQGQVW